MPAGSVLVAILRDAGLRRAPLDEAEIWATVAMEDLMRRRDVLTLGLGAAAAAPWLARTAAGQVQFPTLQIHVIVPSSAGGVHDVIGRIWADRVKSSLGSIVVENRAGGGSTIALNYAVQQPADGHTLLVGRTSTLVLREGGGNRAYDAVKDIVSVSIFATTSTSIAVNPALVPVNSVQELIAFMKANPGKLSYGSGGVGAITHITPELFKQQAGGLDMLHVPYRGMAPAMNDLLGGQIAVVFPNITAQVVALHRAGKLRILAVNAPTRLEAAPDIPTAQEQGLANFVSQIFFGLFAPAGTPKPVLERINAVTQAEWADKAFQSRLIESGFEPMLGFGPERSDQYLREEFAKWNPVVQKVQGP
jgi:tripartite-type tricarboxylate transporter receptor subunit TctC